MKVAHKKGHIKAKVGFRIELNQKAVKAEKSEGLSAVGLPDQILSYSLWSVFSFF